VTTIETADGPLDARMLGWVADLYGPVDPKYRVREFLEHLFVRGPAGPALHAFAVSGGTPVGHASVVPTAARRGAHELRAGKLEALVVAESHRGRRGGDVPVARTLLDRLYVRADERGFELIHAYVNPAVGRVIRFTRLDGVGAPSFVSLLGGGQGGARRAVAALQLAARAAGSLAARGAQGTPLVRRLSPEDRDLLAVPPVPGDSWAVVADGAFEWYAASPYVRVLELPERGRSRLLVQLPGSPQEPLRVAAWRSRRPGTRAAIAALDAATRLARETDATAVRVQQPRADASLRRAARLLGFVPRRDLTTLWVRAHDRSLERPEAVVSTPMLYLGF
jgi:hypothetical protein